MVTVEFGRTYLSCKMSIYSISHEEQSNKVNGFYLFLHNFICFLPL